MKLLQILALLATISNVSADTLLDKVDDLFATDQVIIQRGTDSKEVFYLGSDVTLAPTFKGSKVQWSCKALADGSGMLKIVSSKHPKTGNEISLAKVTRGELGKATRPYQLVAETTVDGKKRKKTYTVRVLSQPLRYMTWNIWGKEGWKTAEQPIEPKGGEFNYKYSYVYNGKVTNQRDRIAEIIRQSKADVVALQETYGQIDFLKQNTELKHSHGGEGRGENTSILSRYPIQKKLNLGADFNYRGAEIKISDTHSFTTFSSWFTSTQCDWHGKKEISDKQAIEIDKKRRLPTAQNLQRYIEKNGYDKNAEKTPIIVAGDHNSYSHFDFTKETAGKDQNYNRGAIELPVSKFFIDKGYTDSYRTLYPSPLKHPGHTYSTIYNNGASFVKPGEYLFDRPHFRIDYIYHKGTSLVPVSSEIIDTFDGKIKTFPIFDKEKKLKERGVYIFPSDHSAVMTTYEWIIN